MERQRERQTIIDTVKEYSQDPHRDTERRRQSSNQTEKRHQVGIFRSTTAFISISIKWSQMRSLL